MNIDIAKVFFIQSHDWGGQIFLNGSLAKTFDAQSKEAYLAFANTNNTINSDIFSKIMFYTLIPAPLLGTYYIACCNFLGFSPNPNDIHPEIVTNDNMSPINYSQSISAPMPISAMIPYNSNPYPPGNKPTPPIEPSQFYDARDREVYNMQLNEYNFELEQFNRNTTLYNSEMQRYKIELAAYNAELARFNREQAAYEADQLKYQTYLNELASFQAQNAIFYKNNRPILSPTNVLIKNANGISFEPYTQNDSQYTTCWSVVDIPNISKAADVFLLKMHKTNDADDGKYLSLVWPIPDKAGAEVRLTLTDNITTRAQLWNLVRMK